MTPKLNGSRQFQRGDLLVIAALGLLTLLSTPAGAEIVLFSDGRTLKVTGHQAKGELIELHMGSGKLVVPSVRIERILDDEVLPEVEVKQAVAKGIFPSRSWRFDESSKPLFKSRYNDLIVQAARKFDVDASLVSAVIKAESDYNPRTVSHKGARGLMQLMPGTASRFGVVDSFDPVANVYAGTRYLRWLLRTFDGNADLAVAAYNAGEGNVWKYKGVPPFRETVQYIHRIATHIRKNDPPPAVTQ